MKMLTLLGIFIFTFSAFAMNGKTTYQAKIIKPDGYPLEATSVNFRFTVLDTSGSCALYVEDYAAVNMSGSGGLISFALGSGTRSFPVSGTSMTFRNIFENFGTFPCRAPNLTVGSYGPNVDDARKIVMQFQDSSGWQTLPAMAINAVPYAMYAHKSNSSLDSGQLNGKTDAAFVEYSTLVSSASCNPATHAITFNGVGFSCIAVGSGSGGGITSVTTSGTVLSTGGTASAPVISITAATMSSDGYLTSLDYAEFKAKLSASSTQIINTLGYAPVSGAAVTTQINNSNLSGDVSGTISSNSVTTVGGKTAAQISTSVDDTLAATASSTADTIVKRNSSGNFTANDIYANSAKINYVDIYKPSTSFNIRLQAPTSLAANYTLMLPTSSGTSGQVLSTDGSGNLSWVNPSTGSVVSVSATAPLASTGGSNPTISITQATSSTNGYLSSTDWNTFNNKADASQLNAVSSTVNALSGTVTGLSSTVSSLNAASSTYALKSNNLSDLTNIPQARNNLGLGTFATASTIDLGSASATGTLDIARLPSFIGDATIAAASNTIVLSNSGVTAGTYSKVTVDAKGRVTSSTALSQSDVTTALGYTPATSTTLAASFVQKTGDTMTGLLNLPSNGLAVGSNQLVVSSTNVGIGVLNPEAALHLKAGTITNAPLKFTSGTLLSSAQSGTVEYDGSQLYFTDGSNTRRAIATNSAAGSFDNTSAISNTSGNITLSPNNITGSVIVNSSQASISSGTGALVVNGGVGIAGSINAAGNLNLTGSATIGQSLSLSSMTSGSLLFAGASGLVSENNSKLFWDGANQRLGLGTNSPAQTLSVSGTSYFSGNVGIGTSSPNHKLEINGGDSDLVYLSNGNAGLELRSSAAGASEYIDFTGSSTSTAGPGTPDFQGRIQYDSTATANNMFFYTSGTERVRISGAGNVGIGTASPSYRFQVNKISSAPAVMIGGANAGSPRLQVYGLDADSNAWMGLGTDMGGNSYEHSVYFPTGTSNNGRLTLGDYNGTTYNTRMTVLQNGNVGIGTTAPENADSWNRVLDVNGLLHAKITASTANVNISMNAHDIGFYGAPAGGLLGTRTNHPISFYTSSTTRMMISSNGNVGIGTTSPGAKFEVFNSASYISNGTGANTLLKNTSSANGDYLAIGWVGEDSWGISSADASVYRNLSLQPFGGNVGIGTTAPGYTLHVVGTAGLSTGTAWTNASDRRLKDIQGDYEYGLNEILKLHTVRYNYKKDNALGLPSDFSKTGFIAQEVQKVIPDAVNVRKDGYLELNVDPIHWAVVNAVKDLYKLVVGIKNELLGEVRGLASIVSLKADKAEIEVLKAENAELKAKDEAKSKRLESLEAYLCSKDPNAPICK